MPTTPPDFRSDGSTPPRRLRGARRGAAALSQASGAGHAATTWKHRMRCRALTLLSSTAKRRSRSPGKTSASFARWYAERSNLHRLLAMRLLELRGGDLHLNNSLICGGRDRDRTCDPYHVGSGPPTQLHYGHPLAGSRGRRRSPTSGLAGWVWGWVRARGNRERVVVS